MARKTTFLYKVKASLPGQLSNTTYVYARNKSAAVDGIKQMKPELKFAHFDAVCFAEADFDMHPDLFKPLTNEEIRTVESSGWAKADSYSRRKDTGKIPEDAEFVSKEEVEKMLA